MIKNNMLVADKFIH